MFMFVSLQDGPGKNQNGICFCWETDQFLSKYYIIHIYYIHWLEVLQIFILLNSIAVNASNINVYISFTAELLAVKRT